MNIVMLGHSSAGKTTFVSLMYAWMNQGVEGFNVVARTSEDDRRLKMLAQAILARRYPDPTDQRFEYDFLLRYGNSSLIPFTWHDYRGGALLEGSSSSQSVQLREDLRSADGIVLFVDGHELYSRPTIQRKVRTLSVLVSAALDAREQETPLVVAITKADLIPDSADPSALERAFGQLHSAVSRHRHVYGTFSLVACGPEPMNIPVPVLFCLHFGIQARARTLEDAVRGNFVLAQRAASLDTAWDRLRSRFQGEPSYREISNQYLGQALLEYQELQYMIGPSKRLLELLGNIQVF
jgi:hypothetical protein